MAPITMTFSGEPVNSVNAARNIIMDIMRVCMFSIEKNWFDVSAIIFMRFWRIVVVRADRIKSPLPTMIMLPELSMLVARAILYVSYSIQLIMIS